MPEDKANDTELTETDLDDVGPKDDGPEAEAVTGERRGSGCAVVSGLLIVVLIVAVAWLGWKHMDLRKQVNDLTDQLSTSEKALGQSQATAAGAAAERTAIATEVVPLIREHALVGQARLRSGNVEGAEASLARALIFLKLAEQAAGDAEVSELAPARHAADELATALEAAPGATEAVPGSPGTASEGETTGDDGGIPDAGSSEAGPSDGEPDPETEGPEDSDAEPGDEPAAPSEE